MRTSTLAFSDSRRRLFLRRVLELLGYSPARTTQRDHTIMDRNQCGSANLVAPRRYHFSILTKNIVGRTVDACSKIVMIEDVAAAEASLDPMRSRLLIESALATTLAHRVGLARQKVNYHLKMLEARRLVELVAEDRKGNMTERALQAWSRPTSFCRSC
jgi:DNA-binding transcriptional ArsR family regulator